MTLKKVFQTYKVDGVFKFIHTFIQADLSLFVDITEDYNVFHANKELAKQHGFEDLIIPGLLTASFVTHIGGLIRFPTMKVSFKFIKPVYVNDTITITATVIESNYEKKYMKTFGEYYNQNNIKVLRCKVSDYPSLIRLMPT
ncbi:MAG: MaoC/PaaZ C-terminal domain-containing protein [Desulfurella sp.]|uniref:MaoC/PaaZ C-terminal domain-containing protein n=1 Tax=Desulfurella sp. TaxID=1962857 RepID=UPI003D13EF75